MSKPMYLLMVHYNTYVLEEHSELPQNSIVFHDSLINCVFNLSSSQQKIVVICMYMYALMYHVIITRMHTTDDISHVRLLLLR